MCGEAVQKLSKQRKISQKCAYCRGLHVASYRGCPAYKDQAFRQHLVQNQVSYASILKTTASQQVLPPPPSNTLNFTADQIVSLAKKPPPPSNTFNFTADQIVFLATNVAIQVALPQLCTKSLPEKQVQGKSDLLKQIAETAKHV